MMEAAGDAADTSMEQRALAAEARAAELLAEVQRLQALVGGEAGSPLFRSAPMLTSQAAVAPPPETEPPPTAVEAQSSTGWGLGSWGLDTVKQVAAVALESTGAAVPAADVADGDAAGALAHRWSRFASLCIEGSWRKCICLADAKGCQVWDIDESSDVRLLAQLHVRGVSCIAPLHTEEARVSEGSALSDASIVAVGATNDDGATTLAFYSLAHGRYVQVNHLELASIQAAVDRLFGAHEDDGEQPRGSATEPPVVGEPALDEVPLPGGTALQLRLPGPVCDLIAAAPHLVVAVEGAVVLLDSCTAMPADGQKLRAAAALPPPPTEPQRATVAVAVSAQWLAYAEPGNAPTAGGLEKQDATQDELSLSSALSAATGMGSRLLDAVTQPAADAGHAAPHVASAGVVVLEGRNVSTSDEEGAAARLQFTAHRSSPISALQFDRTGRLLVTASQGGKTLKVFRIPDCSGSCTTRSRPTLLYTLTRGTFMDAEICSINFSDDSRFVAVATSHGTAHIFAISPFGGAVDAVTHGIGSSIDRSAAAVASSDQRLQQTGQCLQDGTSVLRTSSAEAEAKAETAVPNLTAVARVKRSWIPSQVVRQGFPESQTATHYTIRCSTHSGESWEVSKRYSELAALKSQLEKQPKTSDALTYIAKNAEFPAKTWGLGSWGKLDESTIKARKEKLQLWLGNVLQHCVNEPAVLEFLRPETATESGGDAGDLATEWPIRVEFIKTENKSDGTLLPMAVNFAKPGGGRLTDSNGDERVARESFMVFSAGQLSLHHILMDIAVSISEGGTMQL